MIPDHLLLTMQQTPGLGIQKIRALVSAFPMIESWRELLDLNLTRIDGISGQTINRMREIDPDCGKRILDELVPLGARYIPFTSTEYPPLLKEIYDPAVGLYVRGRGKLDCDFLAIVGSRRTSDYGRSQARSLAQAAVAGGLGIVSGFARGIDTHAHLGTLDTNGHTIAVLGTGVDVVYPRENEKLFARLLESGLAISEFPPGTHPEAHHFPRRNRIISGMSLGTLVIEAGKGSGALITAIQANDQGRAVFAVPGRVDDRRNAGCHMLIQDGAKLVTTIEDVFAELPSPFSVEPGQQVDLLADLDEREKQVFENLERDPTSVDKIAEDLGWEISDLLSQLLLMEMRGLVVQSAGKQFARAV